MVDQYGRVKRFLPAVLCDLYFQAEAASAGEHTLSAIHYLTELNDSKKRTLDISLCHSWSPTYFV